MSHDATGNLKRGCESLELLPDSFLLQAFEYDLQLRNLSVKTISCYRERMGYLSRYLAGSGLNLMGMDRKEV